MTSKSDIARIKATVTVDDVLARHGVVLRRVASGRAGTCPVCGVGQNRKSRSLKVSADGRAWYCFGDCKRGGSVIDLVMALEHCDVRAAVAALRR